MIEIPVALAGFFEDAPLLGRVLLVSLELLLLSAMVALAVKVKLVRTHRLQSLLWCIVLLNATVGLAMRAPLEVALWEKAAPAPVPIAASAKNIHRPMMREADFPEAVAVPLPTGAREQITAMTPPAGVSPSATVHTAPAWWRGISISGWIVAAWATGSSLWLAYLLLERWRLHRLLQRTIDPSHALAEHYDTLAKAVPRWWRPRLRVTADLESPAIVGVIRPVILVPTWLERDGSAAQWTWTLRHELNHWRHGDTIGQSLRLVAQALLFFHPCVWWAGKRWEEAAELACDRSLLETESDAVGYAQELCELLGMIGKRQRPLMSTGLFASRSHIGRRIELLLADPLSRPARLRVWHRALAALVLVGLLGVEFGAADQRSAMIAPVVSPLTSAAPPTERSEPGARVLQFPESYSMGELYINGESVEARGAVTIPAGTHVSLQLNDAGAADLSPLAGFGSDAIQDLSLSGTSVSDEQLVHIQGLTGLTELGLNRTPITDEGMQYLSGMTQLTRLNLNGTAVGDEGMQYVRDMTVMQELILNRTNVSDEGLSYIQGMTELTYLDMWMLDITDEGMRNLAGLTRLDELGIEDTLITDAGLQYLEGLEQLRRLNLENNNITDAGLASLLKLPSLAELGVRDTYLTDAGMALLAQFPALQGALLPMQIGPEGMKFLEGTAVGNYVDSNAGPRRPVSVTITGEGRPLPDAHFYLVEELGPNDDEVHVYRTGATGQAQLYLPGPPKPVRLRAFAQGYVTGEEAWAAPAPDALSLDLEAASVIGGTVVDDAGEAVQGVAVSIPVLGSYNWDAQVPLPHSVSTDENGRWTCDVAPKELGEFWVSLDHPAYATTTYTLADLSVAALRDSSAVLTISDAIGLPGLVVDEAGRPVLAAEIVEMESWRQSSMRATGRAAKSDEEGSFEIKPIRPGESLLKVTAAGFSPHTETVTVTPDMDPVRIVMAKAGKLRGRVVSAAGEPMSGIDVWAASQAENGILLGSFSGKTDNEGRFIWPEAPGGNIGIQFRRENDGVPLGANYHEVRNVQASEEEQEFTVPFGEIPQGVAMGQAIIDTYNAMHDPEAMGALTFSFETEEKFSATLPGKVVKYEGIRLAGGLYQETMRFGENGDEKPPWRHSWDGATYVRHGHAAPNTTDWPKDSHYFVGEEIQEPGHLVALDWLAIFVRDHSYIKRFRVIQYDNGVITLGDDAQVAMKIRFVDPRRLYYDRIEYYDVDGRNNFTVEATDWTSENGIAFPATVKTRFNYQASQGEGRFKIVTLDRYTQEAPATELLTWEIPVEATIAFQVDDERKTVNVKELDAALVGKKAYWEAIAQPNSVSNTHVAQR